METQLTESYVLDGNNYSDMNGTFNKSNMNFIKVVLIQNSKIFFLF